MTALRVGSLRTMGGLWAIRAQQHLNQQCSRWASPGSDKHPLPGPRSRSCCLVQDASRLTVFLQSWTSYCVLGKAVRCCLSPRHNLSLLEASSPAEGEQEALGWVEHWLQRAEPTSRALAAEASSEADLSWAPAVHLPKGFLNHLVPERKSHMVTKAL